MRANGERCPDEIEDDEDINGVRISKSAVRAESRAESTLELIAESRGLEPRAES